MFINKVTVAFYKHQPQLYLIMLTKLANANSVMYVSNHASQIPMYIILLLLDLDLTYKPGIRDHGSTVYGSRLANLHFAYVNA